MNVEDGCRFSPEGLNLLGAEIEGLFPADRLPAAAGAKKRGGDPLWMSKPSAETPDLGAGEAGGNRVLWIAPDAKGFRMRTAHQERAGIRTVEGAGGDPIHGATPLDCSYWTITIPASVPFGMSAGLAPLPMG